MEYYDISIRAGILKSSRFTLPRFFVYAWIREEEYFYIGKTKHGISRLRNHPIINKIEPRKDNDIINIWLCSVDLEMNELERNLIYRLQPKYNKQCNPNWEQDYSSKELDEIELPSIELAACRNAREVKELIKRVKDEHLPK